MNLNLPFLMHLNLMNLKLAIVINEFELTLFSVYNFCCELTDYFVKIWFLQTVVTYYKFEIFWVAMFGVHLSSFIWISPVMFTMMCIVNRNVYIWNSYEAAK